MSIRSDGSTIRLDSFDYGVHQSRGTSSEETQALASFRPQDYFAKP